LAPEELVFLRHTRVLLTFARFRASTWWGDAFRLDGHNVAALFELYSTRSGFPAVNAPLEHGSPDDTLVRAAQQGDRSAFGLLYSRYARMVHGILLCRVPQADVDDLVQDVFLQALPRLTSLREISKFPGWLAAIARNRATDFHRRSKPADEFAEERTGVDADTPLRSTPFASHSSTEAHAALDVILSLPESYRETLILRLVEGMTGPEIAARTGLTHGSVRVNLHRGMQQLREILSRKAAPLTGGEL
jgi:RNA polymerase sigma-70 factor, ECF subfamily